MIQGLTHWNYKIRTAEAENLKYFYVQDEIKNLIDKVVDKGISTAAKTEIEKIRKAPM